MTFSPAPSTRAHRNGPCRLGLRRYSDCWLDSVVTDYAVGTYSAMLLLAGLVGSAAALRLVDGLDELFPMHTLGPFAVVTGTFALAAAGNTGLVVGATTILVGAVAWIRAGRRPSDGETMPLMG